MSARRFRHDERGAQSVELVLIAPVLVSIILLLVAGGRLTMAEHTVLQAATAAARDATLARTGVEAEERAAETARLAMERAGQQCRHVDVVVDASGLDTVLGEAGSVTATVTCLVDLSDAALPGLPGTQTLIATASSPVDPYRARA